MKIIHICLLFIISVIHSKHFIIKTSDEEQDYLNFGQAQTVTLNVHYESLCSDSVKFITEQLLPSWKHFGDDMLKLDLNPFGKANFTRSGSSWEFNCQHGPKECRGNKVQACILDKVRDPAEYLPLISCLMRKWKSPHYPTSECIGLVGTKSVTVKEVEDCANSDEGSNLLHDFGLKTQALDPPLTFVPWQIFNNVFREFFQASGLKDLTRLLCCTYFSWADKCDGYGYEYPLDCFTGLKMRPPIVS